MLNCPAHLCMSASSTNAGTSAPQQLDQARQSCPVYMQVDELLALDADNEEYRDLQSSLVEVCDVCCKLPSHKKGRSVSRQLLAACVGTAGRPYRQHARAKTEAGPGLERLSSAEALLRCLLRQIALCKHAPQRQPSVLSPPAASVCCQAVPVRATA